MEGPCCTRVRRRQQGEEFEILHAMGDTQNTTNAALDDEIQAVNAIYDFPVLERLDGEYCRLFIFMSLFFTE